MGKMKAIELFQGQLILDGGPATLRLSTRPSGDFIASQDIASIGLPSLDNACTTPYITLWQVPM